MTAREQIQRRKTQRRRDAVVRLCGMIAAFMWLWDFHELTHPTKWSEAHSLGLAISIAAASSALLCAVVYLIARTFSGGES